MEVGLLGGIDPERVGAGGLERRAVGEPRAEVVRMPSEPDTDPDRLRILRMRHAASLRPVPASHATHGAGPSAYEVAG